MQKCLQKLLLLLAKEICFAFLLQVSFLSGRRVGWHDM